MQFKVPQFLDIEDKIFGPFTFRQFIYLVGGAGVCFVIYKAMPLYFGIFLIVPIGALTWALTFYRVNNKPFIFVMESAFKYALQDKLYIWQRREKEKNKPGQKETTLITEEKNTERNNRVGTSRLKDLAWSLDVLDMKKGNNIK